MTTILPIDIDQFQRTTLHLKGNEVGAYILLIMAMFNSGGQLPDEDRLLARYAKIPSGQWAMVRELISPLFIVKDGVWKHSIVNEILEKKLALSSKRSQCAKMKSKDKLLILKEPTPAIAKQNTSKTPTKPVTSEGEFDEFWKLYTRKEDKEPARKAFATAAKTAKHETILAGLQKQVEEWKTKGTEKQFIPLAATWLNKRRWMNFNIAPSKPVDKLALINKYLRMVDTMGQTWTLEMTRELGMDETQARLWYKQNQAPATLL